MDILVKVKIDGKPHGLQFDSVQINHSLFTHCEINLQLSFDRFNSERVINDQVSKWIGKKLEIQIYDRIDTAIKKIYTGDIMKLSCSIDSVFITAYSEDHILSSVKKYKSYSQMDIIGIVNDIIKNSGIAKTNVKPPDSSLSFDFFQQYNETDYNCLKRLAKYDGCVFYNDGENFVYSNNPETAPNLQLELNNISDIALNLSVNNTNWFGMPYNYVKHTDQKSSEFIAPSIPFPKHPFGEITYNASKKIIGNNKENVFNELVNVRQSYEKFIKNQQLFSSGNMVKISGKSNHPLLSLGRNISCSTHTILKEQFIVSSISIVFDQNSYNSNFEAVTPDAILEPTNYETNNFFYDTANVIDNVDKEKLGRVQIQYLWDLEGKSHAWARISQFGAGNTKNGKSYGTHFTPRISDIVLVACENGDPSLPVIIGSLYHSEHKPDFKTNNGTEEILVLKTPQESEIRVLDKGGSEEIIIAMRDNTNIIHLELKQPQITIESLGGTIIVHSKNIKITADEKIEMKAKNIDITAEKNIKVEVGENYQNKVGKDYKLEVSSNSEEKVGQNKKLTAGMNLEVKAGTKAEISSGVQMKISSTQIESAAAAINVLKGALVQIN
jgi:hypothetical protein